MKRDELGRDRPGPEVPATAPKKTRFLWGLMVFSIVYYFLLPIGAGVLHRTCSRSRSGAPINVGLLFALSEFIVAWGIAWMYARRANTEFDAMSVEINRVAATIGSTK